MENNQEKKILLTEWLGLKYDIHCRRRTPNYKEGDIWWCIFGENVGVEINGKKEFFLRPVLVFKKYNRQSFMGIPLTTKTQKVGSWYVHFLFHGKEEVAVLSQNRSMSTSRLYKHMGSADAGDLLKIKDGFRKLYGL